MKIKKLIKAYKFKDIIFNSLLKLILKAIPIIGRKKLVKIGQDKNNIAIVEKEYDFNIKEPLQPLARKRFKNSCGVRRVDCFFGVKIENVRLIGPFGIPFTNSGKIILEPISETWLLNALKTTIIQLGILGFLKQYFLAIFPMFDAEQNFIKNGGYLLCRGSKKDEYNKKNILPVFGHWLGEQLPQIRGIEGVCKKFGINCPLIINKYPTNWQVESLELMGYKKNDLFEFNQKGLRVGEIIIASLRNVNSRFTEFDPKARRWAAERLQSNLINLKISTNKKKNIFLFRQNEKTRRISNYDLLKKILLKNNYYEANIENMELLESAKNFFLAKNFLATYGSGILRIMFMANPKKLIEIFSMKQEDRDVFFLLASEFNMEYSCVFAEILSESQDSIGTEKKDLNYEDEWLVSVENLEQTLNENQKL